MKKEAVLGQRLDLGESLSFAVKKGQWFTRLVEGSNDAASGKEETSYTVFSCSLVPGFDIRDFRAAKYKDLCD